MKFGMTVKKKTIRVEIGGEDHWHAIHSIPNQGIIQLDPYTIYDEEMRNLDPGEMDQGVSPGGSLYPVFREVSPANVCLAAAEIAGLFGFNCQVKNPLPQTIEGRMTTGGLPGKNVTLSPGSRKIIMTQTSQWHTGDKAETIEVPKLWVNQYGRPTIPLRVIFSMIMRVESILSAVARTNGRNRPSCTIYPDGQIKTR